MKQAKPSAPTILAICMPTINRINLAIWPQYQMMGQKKNLNMANIQETKFSVLVQSSIRPILLCSNFHFRSATVNMDHLSYFLH